jgi:hypothetical protein
MLRDLLGLKRPASAAANGANGSLQLFLWSIWTLAVAGVAYFSWHADRATQHPLNVVGLVIHCGLVGIVGLVVITLVEMRLEPWRFTDESCGLRAGRATGLFCLRQRCDSDYSKRAPGGAWFFQAPVSNRLFNRAAGGLLLLVRRIGVRLAGGAGLLRLARGGRLNRADAATPAKQPHAEHDHQRQQADLERPAQPHQGEAKPPAAAEATACRLPAPRPPIHALPPATTLRLWPGLRAVWLLPTRLCVRATPAAPLRVRARLPATLLRVARLPIRAAHTRRDLRPKPPRGQRHQQRQPAEADRDPSKPTSPIIH